MNTSSKVFRHAHISSFCFFLRRVCGVVGMLPRVNRETFPSAATQPFTRSLPGSPHLWLRVQTSMGPLRHALQTLTNKCGAGAVAFCAALALLSLLPPRRMGPSHSYRRPYELHRRQRDLLDVLSMPFLSLNVLSYIQNM